MGGCKAHPARQAGKTARREGEGGLGGQHGDGMSEGERVECIGAWRMAHWEPQGGNGN